MTKTITVEAASETTAADFARKLTPLPGYHEELMGDDRAVVKVGKQWLMRMIGVYVYSDYTAPVKVEVEQTGEQTRVTMSPPQLMLMSGSKVEDFFSRTYAKIEAHLQ